MKSVQIWRRLLKTVFPFCAVLLPFSWVVLGGKFRTPLFVVAGSFGIYLLWRQRLHRRLRSYGRWAIMALLLTGMGAFRAVSESVEILPIWFILVILYAVPAGILMAHCLEESKSALNWIYACMMLLFAAWSFEVMQQIDLTQIVRMTSDAVIRGDQKYPVELFGIFSWENVKMQLIPWCAYPIAAVIAIGCRGSLLARGVLVAAAVLACYVAGAFVTRTVFLAGGLAIVAVVLVYMLKANRKRQFVMAAMVFLLAIGSVEVVHTVPVVNEFVMGLFDRFSITADDGRQYLWASSFRLILNHPMGGGDALLEENLWAHNLPLDMGLLYGIPGFVIMTWLLALLVRPVVKWMMALRGGIEIFEVTLLSMFIAALVCSLISPPDIAFLTPLIMVGAFAKERAWMEASRAKVRPRAIGRTAMLAPLATN